jgi:hypothetical protein
VQPEPRPSHDLHRGGIATAEEGRTSVKGFGMKVLVVSAASAAALLATGSVGAAPGVPVLVGPGGGSRVQHLPAFAWRGTRGADQYEFQLAPDPSFKTDANRIVTGNTRATLTRSLPNGTYWWRVRALAKSGAVSNWSTARSVVKQWSTSVRLTWPTQGATVQFPRNALTLRWAPVAGAASYLVSFGTHNGDDSGGAPTDRDCNSIVGDRATETSATSYSVNLTPATAPGGGAKTYYWSVTPMDAERNRGNESACTSFRWVWPSATRVSLRDLRAEPETFDPQLSWDPVPGAAKYEVEINSSDDWSPGARVCCNQPIVGTTLSPTKVFRDNTYYWRVRPIDGDGNAGVWSPSGTEGTFEKVFDRAAALGRPSIDGLHMRDNVGDIGTGASTSSPLVVWSAVPGAASYTVQVAPFPSGFCDWTNAWTDNTAVTAWTPLGIIRGAPPYPADRIRPAQESQRLVPGLRYCVRVRARSDRDERTNDVFGDFTYLGGIETPAFTYAGQAGTSSRGYLSAGDYLTPRDSAVTTTPYFAWRPSRGTAWFVLVAKDPDFHTILDYAFTNVPVYAPRRGLLTAITYPDETTKYYWAVLPAQNPDGTSAVGDPLAASAATFQKQSIPPTLSGPTRDAGGQVVFQWTPVEGARTYHLQVSRDAAFGTTIDDVTTDSVSYTSNTSYPADVCLYWRVRAETEDGVGLGWSTPPQKGAGCDGLGTFKRSWPVPRLVGNPTSGDQPPTITWAPVVGAVWYDVHVEQPGVGPRDFGRVRSTALTFTQMTGTGNFRWKVRADFAAAFGGVGIPGPYSAWHRFTRTISPPASPRLEHGSHSVLFSWTSKPGTRAYNVEVATGPDFRRRVELMRTDESTYAPLLSAAYSTARTFYWRVAAVDEGGNVGAFTKPQRFSIRVGR